jgi:hypothetical protein
MASTHPELDGDPSEAELGRHLYVGEKLDRLENRATWLDAEFRIPLTNIRIGVASIVGFLPGAGDGAMLLLAATIIYHGIRLGAPTLTLIWMSIIVTVEAIIGVIPVVGDIIGIFWTANIQNVGYLRANQDALDGSTNWVFVLLLFSPVILLIILVGSVL